MSAVLAVIGCREERKVLGNAIGGYIGADHSGSSGKKIYAIADPGVDVIRSADHADCDVGDIVIGPPPVRQTRLGPRSTRSRGDSEFSGAVGGTRKSSRNSSAQGTPQLVPLKAWPGYLSRMLMRSVRLLAAEPIEQNVLAETRGSVRWRSPGSCRRPGN